MKKLGIYLLGVFFFLHFVSCKKNPFVPKERIDHIRDSIAATKMISNVCFIYQNDIYFLDNYKSGTPQKITNTPSNTKKEVRISHNLQKIAYLNGAGNPEIIDRNGTVLAILTAYSGIRQMDWSANDSTLYMLIGNQFYYYGPAISHPTLSLGSIPLGSSPQILSATLSMNNDLAYIVDYYDFSSGYIQKLIIKKNDGSNTELVVDNVDTYHDMKYVKFSVYGTDMVLGYSSFSADTFDKIEIYSDLKTYPDSEVPFSSNCVCKYHIFRSDKKCLLSAFSSNTSWSGTGTFILSAYYVNDLTFINNEPYTNAVSDIIIDWK
ncbi:MAG: hypothetical protein NTX97_07635 [Bacteroidetes bacterium]|nr:hypothetical protein [Bacteroidota bacterium]